MDNFALLEKKVIRCERCPRLRRYCLEIAKKKKREFQSEPYWGLPVPGFGDPTARVWILGLAPAAHGANRTGRMFTGDSSGKWLYRALHRIGASNHDVSLGPSDGLSLKDVYISSAARCAPPDNKPLPVEIHRCSEYLDEEFSLLKNVRLFLALGNIGYQAIWNLLDRQKVGLPRPRPKFQHNKLVPLGKQNLLLSYHPSRQNTQTGKLTGKMWDEVFDRIGEILGNSD